MSSFILEYIQTSKRPDSQIRKVIINSTDNYEVYKIIEKMSDESLYAEGIIRKDIIDG